MINLKKDADVIQLSEITGAIEERIGTLGQ